MKFQVNSCLLFIISFIDGVINTSCQSYKQGRKSPAE